MSPTNPDAVVPPSTLKWVEELRELLKVAKRDTGGTIRTGTTGRAVAALKAVSKDLVAALESIRKRRPEGAMHTRFGDLLTRYKNEAPAISAAIKKPEEGKKIDKAAVDAATVQKLTARLQPILDDAKTLGKKLKAFAEVVVPFDETATKAALSIQECTALADARIEGSEVALRIKGAQEQLDAAVILRDTAASTADGKALESARKALDAVSGLVKQVEKAAKDADHKRKDFTEALIKYDAHHKPVARQVQKEVDQLSASVGAAKADELMKAAQEKLAAADKARAQAVARFDLTLLSSATVELDQVMTLLKSAHDAGKDVPKQDKQADKKAAKDTKKESKEYDAEFAKWDTAQKKARALVSRGAGFKGADFDGTVIKQKVDDARKALSEALALRDQAVAAADQGGFAEATGHLAAAQAKLTGIKDLIEAARNAVKQRAQDEKNLAGALTALDTQLASARTQLVELVQLPEADVSGTAVAGHVGKIRAKIDEATNLRETAVTGNDGSRLQEAIALLEPIDELAKMAQREAKDSAERTRADRKAMPAWGKRLAEAESAVEVIRALPGADAQLKEINLMLAQARGRIREQGELKIGYQEAVDVLAGHPAIVERARAASAQFLQAGVPDDIARGIGQLTNVIEGVAPLAPEFVPTLYRDELVRVVELARTDAGAARTQLAALADRIKEETRTLRAEKDAAEQADARLAGIVTQAEADGLPVHLFATEQRVSRQVRDTDLADRNWQKAERQLRRAADTLEPLLAAAKQHGPAWTQKQVQMNQARDVARELMAWPPLAGRANAVIEARVKVLDAFKATGDYAACIAEADAIVEAAAKLEEEAAAKEVPRGEKLQKHSQDVTEANDAFRNQDNETVAFLQNKIYAREDLDPDAKALLSAQVTRRLDEIRMRWDRTPRDGKLEAHLATALEELAKASHELGDQIDRGGGGTLLRDLQQQQEQDAATRPLKQRILELAAELEKFGYRMADARRRAEDKGASPQALQKLYDELKAVRAKAGSDLERGRVAALLDLDRVQRPLGKRDPIKSTNKNVRKLETKGRDLKELGRRMIGADEDVRTTKFNAYKKELQTESLDLQDLLASDDPYVVQIAQQELQKLRAKVEKFAARDFKDVEARWDELSARLGNIEKVLPRSYDTLYKELAEAIVKAQKSSTEDGKKALDAVAENLAAAEKKVAPRERKIKEYQRLKKRIRKELWPRVERHAGAMASYPKFEGYLRARIKDAQNARNVEDTEDEAVRILEALQTELHGLLKNPAGPKLALREAEARCKGDLSKIKAMGRQFQTRIEVFKKQALPAAERAVAADPNGDKQVLKSLKTVIKSSKDVVKPYLRLLERSAQVADKLAINPDVPQIDKALSAFARAGAILEEAERTAARLADASASTTNVNLAGLKRVRDRFERDAAAFGRVVRGIAAKIREAAQDETDPELLKDVGVAVRRVTEAAAKVRAEAFRGAFATLLQDGKDPELKAKQLAAREQVLRTMRRHRVDLRRHPVIAALVDRSRNPFDASRLKAAEASLRTALKEVELQVLVGE